MFMSAYCMFDLSVYYLFLQYFDAVGWVFRPVKTVSHITYTVLAGKTLNPIHYVVQYRDRIEHSPVLTPSLYRRCRRVCVVRTST